VTALREEQRAWLKSRDTACGGKTGPAAVVCLTAVYRARLEKLESMTE
jgi:uncharacterized protein YecT (DUF1311 family)